MLPEEYRNKLKINLRNIIASNKKDLADGWERVKMPYPLDRKYPNAAAEWNWQRLFPQRNRWINSSDNKKDRHHLDPSTIQKTFRNAVRYAGIEKHTTCHTIRHFFATHLLEAGYDIRTIQEIFGQKDIKTTMIYTHVLNRESAGVKAPADEM